MDKESSRYIFIYSSVMVVVVAALLAVAALGLKPYQDKNAEIEKKLNILKAVGKTIPADVPSKNKWVEAEYSKYIVKSYVIDSLGDLRTGVDAFKVDMKEEVAKKGSDRNLPIFEFRNDDSTMLYIIPVRGRGLWGPIWGYVALEKDYNTISGSTFDHQGETPGLGAEINTAQFQAQFKGKKLFEGDKFVSLKVMKGGTPASGVHQVDGISGGTLTSRGLEAMILTSLRPYQLYFQKNKKN